MQNLVITNKGQELIAKMIAGTSTATFTRIKTTEHNYATVDLETLTDIAEVRQEAVVSDVTISTSAMVEVLARIDNTNLATGYYVKAVGLYAKGSDDVEILYAVSIETTNPDYMPAFAGKTSSGISFKFETRVDNSEQVTLEIDPSAVPTIEQVEGIKEDVENIQYQMVTITQSISQLTTNLENKVDKVEGKGLSANDYTDDEKAKLANLKRIHESPTAPEITHEIANDIWLNTLTNEMYRVVVGENKSMSTLPYNFLEGSAVKLNGELHILGGIEGNDKHYKYDNTTNMWIEASTLPYSFYQGKAVILDNEIHIMGGSGGRRKHYKWNGTSWIEVSTLPYSFYQGDGVIYNNEIHIMGGDFEPKKHYKFNSTTNMWIEASTLPYNFYYGKIAILDNEIHILGSSNMSLGHYKFNSTTSTWSKASTLPYSFCHGNVTVLNNEIHLMGGSSGSDKTKHYKYDNTTNVWVSVNKLPYQIDDGDIVVLNNEIHLLGGAGGKTNHYKLSGTNWVIISDTNKVDKLSGKGLSTNDYVTADKNKVGNLPDNTITELSAKADKSMLYNPNLLDNWYFVEPVNQRGQSTYTGAGYTIDRWYIADIGSESVSQSVTINGDYTGININKANTRFVQKLESSTHIHSHILTFTLQYKVNGELKSATGTTRPNPQNTNNVFFTNADVTAMLWFFTETQPSVAIHAEVDNVEIFMAKLEYGTEQTLVKSGSDFVIPIEKPNFAEQLLRCQRYFIRYGKTGVDTFIGYAVPVNVSNVATCVLSLPCNMRVDTPVITLNGDMKIVRITENKSVTGISTNYLAGNLLCFDATVGGSLNTQHTYAVQLVSGMLDISADL